MGRPSGVRPSEASTQPVKSGVARTSAAPTRTTPGCLPLGTVDAPVIVAAERLGIATVAAIDGRHFGVVQPEHLPALKILPRRTAAAGRSKVVLASSA